jgi:hypothetical protein
MDMSETIAAKSDQQNFDDYLIGPRTVSIAAVTKGTAEQPVNIELVEYPGKPFKPNKSMRRVLVMAWGADSSAYVGRRMTLFGNPDVVYGGKAVGGIEISHLSDIPKPLTVALTATRGKRKPFTVQPLAEAPKRDFLAEAKLAAGDVESLKALWSAASQAGAPQEVLDQIRAQAAPSEAPAA